MYLSDKKQKTKIVYVGIGYAGCKVVAGINSIHNVNVKRIAISKFASVLDKIDENVVKFLIGHKTLQGKGTKLNSQVGEDTVLENYDDIKTAMYGADVVMIYTGLGGETGTEVSTVVAQMAKEINAFSISIVTMPFKFEGKKRLAIASNGVKKVAQKSDLTIMFQNQNILSSIQKTLSLKEVFNLIDIYLIKESDAIVKQLLLKEKNDIEKDFLDSFSIYIIPKISNNIF